jgi:hypothetical protein
MDSRKWMRGKRGAGNGEQVRRGKSPPRSQTALRLFVRYPLCGGYAPPQRPPPSPAPPADYAPSPCSLINPPSTFHFPLSPRSPVPQSTHPTPSPRCVPPHRLGVSPDRALVRPPDIALIRPLTALVPRDAGQAPRSPQRGERGKMESRKWMVDGGFRRYGTRLVRSLRRPLTTLSTIHFLFSSFPFPPTTSRCRSPRGNRPCQARTVRRGRRTSRRFPHSRGRRSARRRRLSPLPCRGLFRGS